ncbi:MAG: OmpA family protein [Myxococcota bacterium]
MQRHDRNVGLRLALLTIGAGALGLLLVACGPKYPNCDNDEHCESHNQVCVDGQCRDCRDDSQCNQVDPCMECTADYVCARKAGCCKSDLDCPGGRCWKAEGAETGTCGGECQTDEHCPDNQKCEGGECVPAGCYDDSGCPAGQQCKDGECVAMDCEMKTIYFDFDEYAIRLDQEDKVAHNAKCIEDIGRSHRLAGHCDERGSDEYNLALGQRRANAVKKAYVQLGVNDDLLSTISYGEEMPVCTEHTETCWSENRRVETEQR